MGLLPKALIVFAAAAVLALTAGLVVFAVVWWQNRPVEVGEVEVSTNGPVNLGDVVDFDIVVTLPWNRRPIRSPDIAPAEGIQQVVAGPMSLSRIGLGRWSWVARISLQAVDFPSPGDSSARLFFTADRRGASQPVEVDLPFPEVVPRSLDPDDRELLLAEAINPPADSGGIRWWRWIGLSALTLAAAVVLIAVLIGARIRDEVAPPLPADVAEKKLQDIEDRLPMQATVFFQELSDVVRTYIEMRFSVPATERTTPEFMAMVRDGDWLNVRQGEVLVDFLQAADMVKFAKADATVERMREALDVAGRFVAETRSSGGAESASETGEGGDQ